MPELTDQTVDDEIAADWKEISAKHLSDDTPIPEPETPEPPKPEARADPEVPPKPEKTAEERARDEAGRFKAKEETADPKAAKTPVKTEATAPAQPAVAEAAPRDLTRPPSTWKPAAREAFAALPEAVRAEIHRRETDFLNGQSQLLPDARLGSEMRQAIEPYRMLIEAEGGTPARAVGDLLRTAAVLRMGSPDQKLAAMQGVARQFGVDLSKLAPQIGQPAQPAAGGQGPSQSFQDPRVDSLLANMQQQEQHREQQDRVQRETAAANWMNETDAQGNPVRPYVNDVMAELTALVPQIRQSNPSLSHAQALQEAYERATWAHPEIRALLQQKQQADLEQRRRTENQERVTEARRAASTNVPRRGSAPSPGKPGRMEDTIEETARALGLLNR